MNSIPPITTSILTGMRNGFGMLDRGASEIVDGTLPGPDPSDSAQTGNPVSASDPSDASGDELLSGVRDLMLAKLQIGGAAALMHAYGDTRKDLFDMLR